MKKLDKHSQWDEEWASAFENARLTPPPNVWNNIQAVQADKEANKYRKRVVFYKWIAAASVFISICSAALLLLNTEEPGLNGLASKNVVSEESLIVKSPQEDSVEPSQEISTSSSREQNQQQGGKNSSQIAGLSDVKESKGQAAGEDAVVKQKGSEKGNQEQMGGSQTEELSISGTSSAIAARSGNSAKPSKPVRETENGNATDAQNPAQIPSAAALADNSAAKDNANGVDGNSNSGDSGLIAFGQDEQAQAPGELPSSAGNENNDQINQAAVQVFLVDKKELITLEVEKGSKVSAEIRKVWVASNFLKKEKNESVPRFMLGASLASNSFNANYLDNSPEINGMAENLQNLKPAKESSFSTARITDWDEEQQSIMSVAGAVQGAAWLSKRWILQGGLQYGNYKTSGTASTFTDPDQNLSFPLHFSNYSQDKVEAASFRGRSASTVEATNTFEFLSVPLSIGYVVVDRRLSLLLSPGISSEFFLSNQLKAEEVNNLNDFTVSNGEESPFNLLHFRGLISAQLFYKMSDNYLISLEPSYQQAITDFNKSDSFFSSRPSNISIAAGFRYIFH